MQVGLLNPSDVYEEKISSNVRAQVGVATAQTCNKVSVNKLKQILLTGNDKKILTICYPPDVIDDGNKANVLGQKSRTPKLKKPPTTKGKQTVLAGDHRKILTICYPPDVIDDGNKANVLRQKSRTPKLKKPPTTKGKQTVLAGDHRKILAICYPPDVIDDGNKTNMHSKGANTRKRKKPSVKKLKQSPVSGDDEQVLDDSNKNNDIIEPNAANSKKRKKLSAKKSQKFSVSGDDKQTINHTDVNNERKEQNKDDDAVKTARKPSAKKSKQTLLIDDFKEILIQYVAKDEAKGPKENEQNAGAKKRKKSSAKKSKQTSLSGDEKLVLHPADVNIKDSNNLSPCKKHKSPVSLQLKKCSKYPGHPNFYPFNDFSYLLLQHPYNNETQFTDLVKALGNLVVKVYFIGTSPNRPLIYPRTAGECRGTGNIVSSVMKRKSASMQCPLLDCEVCKVSPGSRWGEITVDTAAHNVCDDNEVKRTICVLDYDDEAATVKTVYGVRKNKISEVNDTCKFTCVTHDTKLVGELRKKIKVFKQIHEQLYKKYETLKDNNLVILVSHPHGCQKHVTFGRYMQRKVYKKLRSKTYYTNYYYGLHSCTGSSGAPIYRIDSRTIQRLHPHSKGMKSESIGFSGVVWEEFSQSQTLS